MHSRERMIGFSKVWRDEDGRDIMFTAGGRGEGALGTERRVQ
jgi:hypothetical protein